MPFFRISGGSLLRREALLCWKLTVTCYSALIIRAVVLKASRFLFPLFTSDTVSTWTSPSFPGLLRGKKFCQQDLTGALQSTILKWNQLVIKNTCRRNQRVARFNIKIHWRLLTQNCFVRLNVRIFFKSGGFVHSCRCLEVVHVSAFWPIALLVTEKRRKEEAG